LQFKFPFALAIGLHNISIDFHIENAIFEISNEQLRLSISPKHSPMLGYSDFMVEWATMLPLELSCNNLHYVPIPPMYQNIFLVLSQGL
jgi:hypothetical protein